MSGGLTGLVKVKLLGWPTPGKAGRLHSHDGLLSYTIVRSIGEVPSGMRQVWWWAGETEAWKGPVESEEEAKAACQADYEARVRSALIIAALARPLSAQEDKL